VSHSKALLSFLSPVIRAVAFSAPAGFMTDFISSVFSPSLFSSLILREDWREYLRFSYFFSPLFAYWLRWFTSTGPPSPLFTCIPELMFLRVPLSLVQGILFVTPAA